MSKVFTMAFGDYQFVNDTSFFQMRELFDARRLSGGKAEWVPPKVDLVKVNMGRRLPPADYLYHAWAAFFSERAMEALAETVTGCGEFLPCRTQGREIIYAHMTVELDFNWKEKRSTRDLNEGPRRGKKEMRVWYDFDQAPMELPCFFRLKGRSKGFFTEIFWRSFQAADLIGGIPESAEKPEGSEWRAFFYPREME